jgi:hypothetical protein
MQGYNALGMTIGLASTNVNDTVENIACFALVEQKLRP